ncbi:uracil-DNA glycosylase family protein [Desulfurivibrio sp. C05AmB]|uniref:uracil-DNA glycosylase family protein n=1 Tax=Desulfurivibrio sp. C05AmB TaxID=3374371 RepID=UPI00376F0C3A
MKKGSEYAQLVSARKACHRCKGLTNPADIKGGRFDVEHVGAWSIWQGNLDATLMVVGQDWGDTVYFIRRRGQEGPRNPTNLALVELVDIAGASIGEPGSSLGRNVAFFTNAILCLKKGGLQGKVQKEWFAECASFLRRQIEIVHPLVVVGLGQRAYQTILQSFGLTAGTFRTEVEEPQGRLLPNGTQAFAVYHCGARIRNTHRPMDQQQQDWRRIRPFLQRG